MRQGAHSRRDYSTSNNQRKRAGDRSRRPVVSLSRPIVELPLLLRRPCRQFAEELVQRRRRVVLRVVAAVQQGERLLLRRLGQVLERDLVGALAQRLVVLAAEVV